MDKANRPTMDEILRAMERLADRIANGSGSRLDGLVSLSLHRLCDHPAGELHRFIPGLDIPPNAEAARFMARAAHTALDKGDARTGLARSLTGLSTAPHNPGLWYLAASACFEFGAVESAILLLRHTLWIHPGHRPARRDLNALDLYIQDRWEEPGELTSSDTPPLDQDIRNDQLAFDFDDDGQEDQSSEDNG